MARNNFDIWSGVQVLAESERAAEVAISGITNANPAVVTATGHGLQDGDYVHLTTNIMQLDNRLFRVADSQTDSFALEDVDSTDMDAFQASSENTLEKTTLAANSRVIRTVSTSGGEPTYIDMSTIHETIQREKMGSKSPLRISMTAFFAPNDDFSRVMAEADRQQRDKGVLFRFPSGTEILGMYSVAAAMVPTGSAGQPVETPITISAQSNLTILAA